MGKKAEDNELDVRQQNLQGTIKNLMRKLPTESSTRKQLVNYLEHFDDSVNYLSNTEQRLAFMGNIGTGKTTAICHLLGLLDGKEPVLSTGSGRTTLCEVEISSGAQWEIITTPHTESELMSYLEDFALYLHASSTEKLENSDSFKLSSEVERALRNMLDLRISRVKNSEGKRTSTDNAKKFAGEFDSVDSLAQALFKRIDCSSRTQTVFTLDEDVFPNEWLHNTFKTVNNGTNSNAGLAKHIRIQVPFTLIETAEYRLSVVDTKGVDQTVNRADLDKCLTDNRTISVLCCRFNEAPDKTMSGLLKLATDAGLKQRIAKEVILLVLDRDCEAEKVIDIDEPIGDKTEGREIRSEQVVNDIRRTLQLDGLDVLFFDAQSDDSDKLNTLLREKVSSLRQQYFQRIIEIENAVSGIEAEIVSQSAKVAKGQVKNTLEPWIKKALNCSPEIKEYFLPLIQDIKSKGTYAASVRASVNRKGEWHNLDYYQLLASGAREQVVEQIGRLQDELIVLIDNMLSQNELQPAYSLLKQLKYTTEKRLGVIYQKSFAKGRAVYEEQLSSDIKLWATLHDQWGGDLVIKTGSLMVLKRGSILRNILNLKDL